LAMNPAAGIVLAAGRGSRFGTRKQLALLRGKPLLEYPLAALEDSGVMERIVVLGADAEEILNNVDLHGALPVICEDWAVGQSRSLGKGIEALGATSAAMILLGDQPYVSSAAVKRVLRARTPGGWAVRATYNGKAGHPVLIERRFFAAIRQLEGDVGARLLIDGASAGVTNVPCDDIASDIDVDCAATLEALNRGWPPYVGRVGK